MIDIRFNRGQFTRCMASGDFVEIAAEFGMAISAIYGQLYNRANPAAAAKFKEYLQAVMCNDSPVWGMDLAYLPAFFASGPAAKIFGKAFEGGQQRDKN